MEDLVFKLPLMHHSDIRQPHLAGAFKRVNILHLIAKDNKDQSKLGTCVRNEDVEFNGGKSAFDYQIYSTFFKCELGTD